MEHKSADSLKSNIDKTQENESYLDELSEIKAELSSLNKAVSRMLEHSGHQQMNMMVSEIKNDISRPLINYMMYDTRDKLNSNMPDDCDQKKFCRDAVEKLLHEMSLLLLDKEMDEGKLQKYQERFDGLMELASAESCSSCTTHASRMFQKQMELLRKVNYSVNSRPEHEKIISIVNLPDDVVSSICEPLANKQRLLILKTLSTETKSFSELSKITGLRGGNLLFHLQKLLDTNMIIQRTERGDYLLTNKGYNILQGIAELYDMTERMPVGNLSLESDQIIS